jgi:hypothetical protein
MAGMCWIGQETRADIDDAPARVEYSQYAAECVPR